MEMCVCENRCDFISYKKNGMEFFDYYRNKSVLDLIASHLYPENVEISK